MHTTRVKLSNKGRYAVLALFDIAFFSGGKPAQVKDIAERQGIPLRFLEQIFQDLKKAGFIASKRGPQGGYSLAREAHAVSLGDIVRALEGPLVLGDDPQVCAPGASHECHLALSRVFSNLSAQLEAQLNQVTLADICAQAESLGARRPRSAGDAYMI